MIKIENLTKIYPNGVKAIDNINLHIEKGDIYGIIGLSGAGKSSLIRCVNRLEDPTSGKILINDEDILALDKNALNRKRKKIGMIFQHFNLLTNSTVYENIAFPLTLDKSLDKKTIDAKVKKLLKIVDLEEKKDMYPSQLSGGQKQRVGIARALTNDIELLLSDEATSALDPKTTSQILSLLQRINKTFGITILLITHEMSVIKQICNKVAIIDAGQIISSGNAIDIFAGETDSKTKYFIESEIQLPEYISNLHLLSLTFRGNQATEAIISKATKKLDMDISIVSGNIDYIQEQPLGKLIISITDLSKEKVLIEFLTKQGVKVEVKKNGTI